jgi:putative RNA 2'-phosphotransferase
VPPDDRNAAERTAEDVKTSKLLSLLLRHRPETGGIRLDAGGWANVDDLLAALGRAGRSIDRARLEQIVRASDKRRFAFSEDGRSIRAQQGHSVEVELGHAAAPPPAALYHGTVAEALPAIRREGLTRGTRHHVHLSADVESARAVGARRGVPIVIEIAAAAMAADGHVFFLSPNGVWLTDHVPPKYLSVPGSTEAALR